LFNIQNQSGDKVVKLPFELNEDKVFTRLSGKDIHIQDELNFKGRSVRNRDLFEYNNKFSC